MSTPRGSYESNPADGLKELVWFAFMTGGQKANIPNLKSLCHQMIQLVTQKTAGQNGKGIPIARMDTITTEIAAEACALVQSGVLDDLDESSTMSYKARWDGIKKYLDLLIEECSKPEKSEALTQLRKLKAKMEWMEDEE